MPLKQLVPPRVQKRARVVSTTRTMSAAMPKAQPLDDVSNLIDLDALNKELYQARSNVEMWMARRELSMKEQVAVHKTNMAVAEEEYVSLVEREKDLATAAEELARRQEYQQAELDALQEEAAQAKELGEDLPQQLQTLRAQVTTEKDDLEREQTKITGEEMVKAQMLQAHLSAVDLYRDRLGLRFEIGDAEELRFFYKRVDPADHEREFMVAVRVVDSGGYELMDCDPDMGDQAQALLAECNRTDNLSGFVRGSGSSSGRPSRRKRSRRRRRRSGKRRTSSRRATSRWRSRCPSRSPSRPAPRSTPSPTIWCRCEFALVECKW